LRASGPHGREQFPTINGDTEIQAKDLYEGDAVRFYAGGQSGKRISLAGYLIKALVITFIYTRCPLPDYCPLMSGNFAEIERKLCAANRPSATKPSAKRELYVNMIPRSFEKLRRRIPEIQRRKFDH
jgi:hypothetical protein